MIPRGLEADFLKTYDTLNQFVVPEAAKHLTGLDDKEGNKLFRVVLFRTAVPRGRFRDSRCRRDHGAVHGQKFHL